MTAVTFLDPNGLHTTGMIDAKGFANLAADHLARLTHTSLRTARRWRSTGLLPRWAFDLVTLLLDRPLGMLCSDWDGWHLRTAGIEAPNGYRFTPAEVISIPLRLQQIAALELELARQKGERGADAGRNEVVQIIAPRRDRYFLNHESLPLAEPAALGARRQPLTLSHGRVSSLASPSPSMTSRPALAPPPVSLPPD